MGYQRVAAQYSCKNCDDPLYRFIKFISVQISQPAGNVSVYQHKSKARRKRNADFSSETSTSFQVTKF